MEIWKIYSYWVFGMMMLWGFGILPFSPLASALATFIGSIIFVKKFYNFFSPVGMFIIGTHLVPLWFLRRTRVEIRPNLVAFVVYNLFLLSQGTNFIKVYNFIGTDPPETIRGHLCQREIVSCG